MRVNLRRYRYRTIRGSDFYEHARRELAQQPNVTWLRGKVEAIEDGAEAARVIINRDSVTGRWVFDSIPRPANASIDDRYHQLKLHFKGWEIETASIGFRSERGHLPRFSHAAKRRDAFLLRAAVRRAARAGGVHAVLEHAAAAARIRTGDASLSARGAEDRPAIASRDRKAA